MFRDKDIDITSRVSTFKIHKSHLQFQKVSFKIHKEFLEHAAKVIVRKFIRKL
jgi:hypothetical protein